MGVGNLVIPLGVTNPLITNYIPLALGIVALALLLNIKTVIAHPKHLLIALMLLIAYLPGFLVAGFNDYATIKLLGIFYALILIVAPTGLRRPDRGLPLLMGLLIVVGIVASLALLFEGVQGNIGRTQIAGLNPIAVARVTALLAVLSTAATLYYWSNKPRLRFLFLAFALLGILATLQTGSRGPLVSALVALVAFLPVLIRRRQLKFRSLVLVLLAGTAVVFFMWQAGVAGIERILSASDTGRGALFTQSLDIIAENPLGIGWGHLDSKVQFAFQTTEGRLYSHNVFLEVGSEAGWIALAATILLLALACINGFLSAVHGDASAALIYIGFVYLLMNAQVSSDIVGNRLLWLFVGLALLPLFSARRSLSVSDDEVGGPA